MIPDILDEQQNAPICAAQLRSVQVAIGLPVTVPKPFVNDLPGSTGPPPRQSGALEFAADLVHALPGRNASSFRQLIVVKRTRANTHRLDDAVTAAAGLHDRQYAPRT